MIGSILGRTCSRAALRRSAEAAAKKAMIRPSASAVVALRGLSTKAASLSGGQELGGLSETFPHMDVVRYEHKNRTWTLQHVHYYSEALAIGLTENGLQSGDVVLSWLPAHLSETVSRTVDKFTLCSYLKKCL